MLATFATPGQRAVASFAIGPLKMVPFGFPLSSFPTPADFSSTFPLIPSGLLYSFFCLTITTLGDGNWEQRRDNEV